MRPKHSVRDLFLTTIGSAVILILITFYTFIFLIIRRSYINTAEKTTDIVIQKVVSQTQHYFEDIEKKAKWLSENSLVVNEDFKAMSEVFFSIAKAHSNFISSIYYGNSQGRFLQRGWSSFTFFTNQGWAYKNIPFYPGVPPLLPQNYDPVRRPWYQTAVKQNSFIITAPYAFITQNEEHTNRGITAAIPVKRGEHIIGVLGIDSSLSVLSRWIEDIKLPGKGKIILIDKQGGLLHWPWPGTAPHTLLPHLFHSNDIMNLSRLQQRMMIRVKNKKMILSSKQNGHTGHTIITIFDYQELMIPGIRALIISLILTLALSIILGFILRIQITDLTSPLTKLEDAMKHFQVNSNIPPAIVTGKYRENEVGRLETAFRDMSASIIKYENDMIRQFYYDALTGLPNRKRLLEDIHDFDSIVLILLNIDDFKEINDFYGHEIGDFVIRMTADRLHNAVGEGTRLYRLPSDEFALLISKDIRDWEIRKEALYFSTTVSHLPLKYKDQDIYVQITAGAAQSQNSEEPISLMGKADMALKRAKQQDLNFILYKEDMEIRKELEKNLRMSTQIRTALKNDKIFPYFQPIMNNQTGKIDKYECLVRMEDETGEILTPYHFLKIAQKSRQYLEITRIMIEKSFQVFAENKFDFSINLSQDDLRSQVNRQYILHMLEIHPNVSNRVVFEILESESIENYEQLKGFIASIRRLGARIAIDDFGTGYSSFEHILELRPDYLKLDASLIKNIHNDDDSRLIVETIAQFAEKLSLSTIAEFVHCQDVMEVEKKLKIKYSQGYFIGKPSPHLLK